LGSAENIKELLRKYLDGNTVQYFIVSKIECPCCCIVKNLLTYENYLNLPEEQVIIIYDNPDKELLSYIRDSSELSDVILFDDNETISDTYPCVFVKEGGKFKYLEGGKDGMIKRFVLTLKSDYHDLYLKIVENIKRKLGNPSESSDIFCRCTESELKPDEAALQKHIDELNFLRKTQIVL